MLRQKKVTQEKATLPYRPSGSFGRAIKLGGCATRPSSPHTTWAAAELKQCSPSPQFDRPPSAIQKGNKVKTQNQKCSVGATRPHFVSIRTKRAHGARDTAFFDLDLPSPYPPPSSAGKTGDFDEHCLSSATGHVLCAPLGRVAQSPVLTSNAGNSEGVADLGAPSFGYLSWRNKTSDWLSGHPRRC